MKASAKPPAPHPAISIACPTCAAQPGQMCRNPREPMRKVAMHGKVIQVPNREAGQVLRKVHAQRIWDYRRQKSEAKNKSKAAAATGAQA